MPEKSRRIHRRPFHGSDPLGGFARRHMRAEVATADDVVQLAVAQREETLRLAISIPLPAARRTGSAKATARTEPDLRMRLLASSV
jgi:hypothetical protein